MWGVDTTKPGSQAYYDSIAELYASWGVDFIKADDMGSHLYQPAEIKALALAIRKTGRPMLLSISPGPAPISEVLFSCSRTNPIASDHHYQTCCRRWCAL